MKRLIAVVSLSISIGVGITSPLFADFAEGFVAYERGDYMTALREWQALAEQGDIESQHNLGVMHLNGQGVPKN